MKNRIKRIYLSLIILVLVLIPSYSVFSYNYVKEENGIKVRSTIRDIYEWYDFYNYFKKDTTTSNNVIGNYNGACSTVQVNGKTYTLDEYIAGVIKHEIGCASDAPEALKAQAIASRSYLIANKKNDPTCSVESSQSFQVFGAIDPNNANDQIYLKAAQETSGMVVMKDGEVARTEYQSFPNQIHWVENSSTSLKVKFRKYRSDATTEWVWSGPSLSEIKKSVNCGILPVTGDVSHNGGMSQDLAEYLAKAENYTYDKIISLFYGSDVATLSDGNYVDNVSFVDSNFGQITYFNQGDYSNYYYSENPTSANTYGGTIKGLGCGPTSLAIVVSSLTGRQTSPVEVTQKVCQSGGCTREGTIIDNLIPVASQYGLNAYYANSNQEVIDALASRNALVIALMGPGTFATGGHYIVLTGSNSSGQVSVADPGSRANTEKKWFSFNTVVEQKKAKFLIVAR